MEQRMDDAAPFFSGGSCHPTQNVTAAFWAALRQVQYSSCNAFMCFHFCRAGHSSLPSRGRSFTNDTSVLANSLTLLSHEQERYVIPFAAGNNWKHIVILVISYFSQHRSSCVHQERWFWAVKWAPHLLVSYQVPLTSGASGCDYVVIMWLKKACSF